MNIMHLLNYINYTNFSNLSVYKNSTKVKVKFSPYKTRRNIGQEEVQLHSHLTLATDTGKLLVLCPGGSH